MAIKIGSLLIRLAVEHGILQEGLARSERDVAKTTKAIQQRGREIADFGQKMSLAVTLPIAGLAVASVKAAQESADAVGQVEAALRSMGDAAGRTSEQLQQLAGEQMRRSLFDDDQILREVTANLLTFGTIAGQEFDRAQQAALDLSTRLGTDLVSATVQIGKALNDPVKGVTALGRAGIQFTADQKAMIASLVETGDVAAAQRIILEELEKQFGGAAQAARDADPGAALAQSFATFQEEVGAKLLPILPPLLDAITGILDVFGSLPEPVQTGVIALGAIAAVVGPIAIGIGAVVSGAAGLIATLGGFPAVASVVGLAMNTLLLTPLGLVVGAVAAVVAAWYYWDEIEGIVGSVGDAVSSWWSDTVAPALSNVGDALVDGVKLWYNLHVGALGAMAKLVDGVRQWLQDKLGAVFDWVGRKIEQVTGFFFDMYDAVVGNSYVPDMVEGIGAEFARLQGLMVDPAQKATRDVTAATRKMAGDVTALLDRLFPEFAKARRLRDELALLDSAGLSEDVRARARLRLVGEGAGDATVSEGLLEGGPLGEVRKVDEAVEQIKNSMAGFARENEVQTVRIAETFQQMVDRILGQARKLVDGIRNGDFLSILEGVAGIFTSLGSTGLFGSGVQSFLGSIPGNANGTAYHPGGLMKVGERGPEILQVPRGGRVIPNHELREAGAAGGVVNNYYTLPSDEFWARVDGRAAVAAAPVAREATARAFSQMGAYRESSLA